MKLRSGDVMATERARAIAEQLHATDVDESGAPVLMHLHRVAPLPPPAARPVAWLHEAFELTGITEQELLESGPTLDELRVLRAADGRPAAGTTG
jgi:hypothetical protein